LRERAGVRGIKKEILKILTPDHPHLDPPPSRGRKKFEIPRGN
jgi:hypothetical protein